MKNTLTLFKPFFAALFITAFSSALSAQDIHLSMFANSPMNLNPGLAGVFGGDTRFTANYRNQWYSIPVPYMTFSGVVENKFYHKKGRYDRFFTSGFLLNYDRQGDLRLKSLQIGVPITFTAPLGKNNFLTFGLLPAFGQRAFNTSSLTFDAQWVDCVFDPSAFTRETQLFNNATLNYFDLSGGLNFRAQAPKTRSRMDLGIGLHHVNRPNHDFWEGTEDVRLEQRVATYLLGYLQVRPKLDLLVQGLYQQQGGYREVLYGGGARFHLNQKTYQELSLQVGVNYRHRYHDALVPHVEAHWRTWTLGFTYDWNLKRDQVRRLTNGNGGPEVALIYRLYKVKPLPKFKSCPII